MLTTPVELPIAWAPRRNRVVLLTLSTLLLAAFTFVAVAMPAPWQLNDRVAMVFSGLVFASVGLMLARPKVSADAEGVTVVNFVRSRRLAWAQIVRVNFRAGDPWVSLDLSDGTALAAVGIQPAGGREWSIAAARTLRDLVEEHATARR